MPYLTRAQVEYLHQQWSESSGINFIKSQLEETRQQLSNLQTDYLEIEAQNAQLQQLTGDQAARIIEVEAQLADAQDELSSTQATITTLQQNQMPNSYTELTGDLTVNGNCIVFMSFTPSNSTFNVATVYSPLMGGGGTIDYPGQYCPYICIVRTQEYPNQYLILTGTASGDPTETSLSGNSISLNYSTNNQNILLLNR